MQKMTGTLPAAQGDAPHGAVLAHHWREPSDSKEAAVVGTVFSTCR